MRNPQRTIKTNLEASRFMLETIFLFELQQRNERTYLAEQNAGSMLLVLLSCTTIRPN